MVSDDTNKSNVSEVFSKDNNTKTNDTHSTVKPPHKNKEEKQTDKKE